MSCALNNIYKESAVHRILSTQSVQCTVYIALSGVEYRVTVYCAFTVDCKLKVEARNRDESQS